MNASIKLSHASLHAKKYNKREDKTYNYKLMLPLSDNCKYMRG